ncbi:MAG: hypothetical protein AAF703_03650 [Cyanobacteria bacterium P01_D01_bin.105]
MSLSQLPPEQSPEQSPDRSSNQTLTSLDSAAIAQMRIASIQAGLVGAVAVAIAACVAWGLAVALSLAFLLPTSLIEWLINIAIALSCGFFFGVTYRYIVRQDDNLHLGSGAVGAFAFVRSLAQIEATWNDRLTPLFWLLVTGESFLWFATARYALDWAMRRQLVESLD